MTVSILVVDDESDVAELFRQRFRREVRQGTYAMHFANSGEEALEKLVGGIEPTLIVILSDINMPGMDGLTLLREIKARRPDLPVMMVTAYGDDERRRRGRGVGRMRVHHQAGRFRSAEGAVAAVAQRGGLRVANSTERPLSGFSRGLGHVGNGIDPRPQLAPAPRLECAETGRSSDRAEHDETPPVSGYSSTRLILPIDNLWWPMPVRV